MFTTPDKTICRRIQFGTLGLVLLLSGCAAFQPRPRPVAADPPPAKAPGLVPVNVGQVAGQVTVLNPQFGFVVLDFGGHRPPAIGTELKLYRQGQVVGAVRLTEPTRGHLVTADLLSGQPQIGDQAY